MLLNWYWSSTIQRFAELRPPAFGYNLGWYHGTVYLSNGVWAFDGRNVAAAVEFPPVCYMNLDGEADHLETRKVDSYAKYHDRDAVDFSNDGGYEDNIVLPLLVSMEEE